MECFKNIFRVNVNIFMLSLDLLIYVSFLLIKRRRVDVFSVDLPSIFVDPLKAFHLHTFNFKLSVRHYNKIKTTTRRKNKIEENWQESVVIFVRIILHCFVKESMSSILFVLCVFLCKKKQIDKGCRGTNQISFDWRANVTHGFHSLDKMWDGQNLLSRHGWKNAHVISGQRLLVSV